MHGPKWPFLLAHGPGVVVVNYWDRFCTLVRAPCTKETLPDFREWCRFTRHPRVFRRLTGCQRTPRNWGVTQVPTKAIQKMPFELFKGWKPSLRHIRVWGCSSDVRSYNS